MGQGRTVTKFEAARRQLVTAIQLFFDDKDSVSIYTLAHAAWEVLDALCKHKGAKRFYDEMANANQLPERQLRKIAEYGRNFLKHADRDPEAVLEDFSDEMNDHVLIAAAMDYHMLSTTGKPIELQVFIIWYFAAHPEKIAANLTLLRETTEELFPGMSGMDRTQQKAAGRELLMKTLLDPELMKHPWTDASPTGAL